MARFETEELYRKYGSLALRRARAILGDEQAAQDAVHDVFINVMRSIENFRGEGSPTTWLYRMMTNHCLNLIRDRARHAELLSTKYPKPQASAEAPLESRLTMSQLLVQMPDELREVAVYYFVDQMNQDEIAELLGVTERTVRNRLVQFKTMARETLGSEEVAK
jgi:RNA polymerase sigma-70 factor (ECF subfamily)